MNLQMVISTGRAAHAQDPRAETPGLETLLARGDPLDIPYPSIEPYLMSLFGYDPVQHPPSAALCVLGEDHEPGNDYWLHADPVCLAPTRTRLTLAELPADDLSAAESRALGDALNDHLAAMGCALLIAHPQRWYLRLANEARIHTVAPSLCAGPLEESHLPSGPDGSAWKRLITEAQILLHEHPVNRARESAGKLPVNAVWPWGGGRLPTPAVLARDSLVLCNDPLARGLARLAGIRPQSLPHDAAALFSMAAVHQRLLAIMTAPAASSTIEALERSWFAVFCGALADGRLRSLALALFRAGRAPLGRLATRSHMRRWWRRKRVLSAYA